MLKRLALAILLLAAPSRAQKPGVAPPAPGRSAPLALLATLPGNLAGFQRGNITDYAVMANDPRLGASVGYRSAQGTVGTVYLYDGGERDIGGRNTASLIEQQLQSAMRDVRNAGQQRRYRVVGERPASVAGLRCTLLDLGSDDGPLQETAACLGTRGALFLKLRVSAPAGQPGVLAAQLPVFAEAVMAALR